MELIPPDRGGRNDSPLFLNFTKDEIPITDRSFSSEGTSVYGGDIACGFHDKFPELTNKTYF